MSKETKDVEICLVEFAEAVMKELKAIKENQKKMWKILSRSKEMRTVVYSRAYGDGLFCSKHNAEATGIYNDYMHESNQIEDVENVPRHDHILNHVAQKMKLRHPLHYSDLLSMQVTGLYRITDLDGSESVEEPGGIEWL